MIDELPFYGALQVPWDNDLGENEEIALWAILSVTLPIKLEQFLWPQDI